MRPGVIRVHRHAARGAALNADEEPVIAACAAGIEIQHGPIILAKLRVLQREAPARLLICGCRTRGVLHSIESARLQSKEDWSIVLPVHGHVDRMVSEITRRYQKILADLSLNTEI